MAISFIPGDENGQLTNEIAVALSRSGLVRVHHAQGDYRLHVSIKEEKSDTIGYRINREEINGKNKREIIPTEGRREMVLEVTLFDNVSDRIAFGPYKIWAEACYDFVNGDSVQDLTFIDASGALATVLPFSLGQLEPNEAAQQAAARPLYARLAQNLVDALASDWQ